MRIDCSALSQTSVLLKRATGIFFEYQIPDEGCERFQCEGVLMPIAEAGVWGPPDYLRMEFDKSIQRETDLFLTEGQCHQIHELFELYDIPLRIDQNRFHEHRVSWLPVVITGPYWVWPDIEEGEAYLLW